ncbi:hypothetical protein GQ600_16238 [Phytophthora cactorum]|nr:hypothetical protein GQ600_16238 [Phytophthora cactorum]
MKKTHSCVALQLDAEFDEGRDTFERVYSLADGKVSSALAKYTTKTTQPDMKAIPEANQHAKQAQFMALTSKRSLECWPKPDQLQAEDVRWSIRRASAHVYCKRSKPRHSSCDSDPHCRGGGGHQLISG